MSLSKLSRLTAMANMHPNWNRSYYKNSRTAVMETEPVDWKYNTRENNMTSSWRLCNLLMSFTIFSQINRHLMLSTMTASMVILMGLTTLLFRMML